MKRYGNLWSQILDMNNLYIAYKKAKLGKSDRDVVKMFEEDIQGNLKRIQNMLANHTFTTSEYQIRIVFEPKRREIFILPFYPDRIVQHALMNICEPIIDQRLYYWSMACRKGKGIHIGSQKTIEYVRQYDYALKADISKFYPSVNHDIIKKKLRTIFKDPNVLWLFDDIIDSIEGETNVPIGNYVSQWLGNLYLDGLDHLVKDTLKIKAYLRYCDDFILFSNNLEELHRAKDIIEKYLYDELNLKFSKAFIRNIRKNEAVDFLGYRHFEDRIELRKTSKKRFRRQVKYLFYALHHGKLPLNKIKSSMYSLLGWLRWCKSKRLKETTEVFRLESEIQIAEEYGLKTLNKIRHDDDIVWDKKLNLYISRNGYKKFKTECKEKEYYKEKRKLKRKLKKVLPTTPPISELDRFYTSVTS